MKIKDFKIDGLYGKYNIQSSLDEQVNIIVGENGSFKTTVLRFLARALSSKSEEVIETCLNEVIVNFDNNMSIRYKQFQGILADLNRRSDADPTISFLAKYVNYRVKDEKNKDSVVITADGTIGYLGDQEISDDEIYRNLRTDVISTFDIKRQRAEEQSDLDAILETLQSDFGYFLDDRMRELTAIIQNTESVSKQKLDQINQRKNLFVSLVNEAFKSTGKQLNPDSAKLTFIIDSTKETITAKDLSSGEKQLLIILLTTLLENGKEYIILLDEPEISLHIQWQYRLIDMIRELNPNAQIILTTHSPSVFSDGWGDKAIYMEDITTKVDKQ